MKKLMVVAAVALASAFANAASVNWWAENVPTASAGNGEIVLFFTAENSGNTLSQVIQALGTDGDRSVLSGWEFAAVNDGGDAMSDDPVGSFAKGTDWNFYAIALDVGDVKDIANASQFAYYEAKPLSVPDNDPETIDVYFSNASSFTDIATAAPEPTSGLLLLLGVAGLALRRRRA